MKVQNTRTSEARPKRKKTRPEPRKHTKGPTLAPLFSALCDFLKFFGLHQRVPLHFFRYFATQWMSKNPKGPPFTFFGTVTLFKNHFSKIFWEIFQSHQRVPPSIFFIFCNQLEFHKARKGPPFHNFEPQI